jgi:hypothetical protein
LSWRHMATKKRIPNRWATAEISNIRKVRSENAEDSEPAGRKAGDKRGLAARFFPSDEVLTEECDGWEELAAKVKEIAQFDMLGEFPKDIATKVGMTHHDIEQLRADYPRLFEKYRAEIMESVSDRFKVNFMKTYEMVGAFAPDCVRQLYETAMGRVPGATPACQKDAAKAVVSFAGELIADKAVKRSGAAHPPEIQEMAKKAQAIMGDGRKTSATATPDPPEEPN